MLAGLVARCMKRPSERICSDNSSMDAGRLDHELRARAQSGWTGALTVSTRAGREVASVYLFQGDLYSVRLRDHQPDIRSRLGAAGIIDAHRGRQFDAAVASGSHDDAVGRYAVEHTWLSVERLAEIHAEYLLAGMSGVLGVDRMTILAKPGVVTNERCSLPLLIADVLATIEMRGNRSRFVWSVVAADGRPRETVLTRRDAAFTGRSEHGISPFVAPELAAFATEIDGARSVDEVANACGFTRAEAEFLAAALVNDGLAEVAGVKDLPDDVCLVPEDAARAAVFGPAGL